jgi:hypothetical protein
MMKTILLLAGLLTILPLFADAQTKGQSARLVFYNVENLFDPFDDTLVRDEQFGAGAEKHWTYGRLLEKEMKIFQVLAAVGGWEPPAVVGLCEVENRFVLQKLVHETPLGTAGYRIVHEDSPDPRGIDVAALCRPAVFLPDTFMYYDVSDADSTLRTRDILYLSGWMFGREKVHVFFNHWPSRGGGEKAEEKRKTVASFLRQKLDSILFSDPDARLIIMGDFNDEPWDESLNILAGEADNENGLLMNLMIREERTVNSGTIAHQGFWLIFDQALVTGNLLDTTGSLFVRGRSAHIFKESFLLEETDRWNSARPSRTYKGPFYSGGFSDHLPVYLDIIEN